MQVRTQLWDTSFTAGQIGSMELQVLEGLGWHSHCATAADFLDRLLSLACIGRNDDGSLRVDGVADAVRLKAQHMVFHSLLGAPPNWPPKRRPFFYFFASGRRLPAGSVADRGLVCKTRQQRQGMQGCKRFEG